MDTRRELDLLIAIIMTLPPGRELDKGVSRFGTGCVLPGYSIGFGTAKEWCSRHYFTKRRKGEGKASALGLFRGPSQADVATCYRTDTCVVPGTQLKSWEWGVSLNRGLFFG